MRGSHAHLIPESPFFALFEHGLAPIHNILVASRVKLEGSPETEAYMLDLAQCTGEQIERIVGVLHARFGWERAQIRADILRDGLPIRASQVRAVSSDSRAFL